MDDIGRAGVGYGVGTCGELVQGVFSSGEQFHVTCPIDFSAKVSVRVRDADVFQVVLTSVGYGEHRDGERDGGSLVKVARACEQVVRLANVGEVQVVVSHSSPLAVGKELGSSTADIVAAARATWARITSTSRSGP